MKRGLLFIFLLVLLTGYANAQARKDSLRILTMGDSYTSGRLVNPDQTFPALLAQKLNKKKYRHSEADCISP